MKFARAASVSSEFAENVSSIVRNEVQQLDEYDVVNKFPIEFEDILVVLNCKIEDNACLLKVAKQLNANVLIFGAVKDKGKKVQITVNVFDVKKQKINKSLIRFFDREKDPLVEFREELQTFFGTKKVTKLSTIEIDANIPKSKIYVNDTFAGITPLSHTNMQPGTYKIRVEAPDHLDWETRITITKASKDVVPVFAQLQEGEGSNTLVDDKNNFEAQYIDPSEDRTLNWGALATTGVGLATMGSSVIFGLQLKNTEKEIDDKRARGTLTRTEYDELNEQGTSQEMLHFILLGTGAAITTVGVVWFAISPSFSEQAIRIQVSPRSVSATLPF